MFDEGFRLLANAGLASSLLQRGSRIYDPAIAAGARFGRGLRIGRKIARGLGAVGRQPVNAARSYLELANRHPSAIVVPVGLATIGAAHPLRHLSMAYGSEMYGDPNALREMAIGGGISGFLGSHVNMVRGLQPGFGINIATGGPGITNEGMASNFPGDPDQALISSEAANNPQGSIIFGLYNNRLR